MKTLVKFFVLFITTTCFAQNPIEKTIGEFSELKVYDLIEVEKANKIKPLNYKIPSDISSAAFFIVLTALALIGSYPTYPSQALSLSIILKLKKLR